MSSVELKKINAYWDWKDIQSIQQVWHFVTSVQSRRPDAELDYPPGLTNSQKKRYKKKFGKDWRAEGGAQRADELYYQPTERPNQGVVVRNPAVIKPPRIRLRVIPPLEREGKIQEVYNDNSLGVGTGFRNFYHKIVGLYIGITEQQCTDFLKKRGDYIIHRLPTNDQINHPILAKSANERWGIDLCHLPKYKRWNYQGVDQGQPNIGGFPKWAFIFVAVDYFSKRVFARPLYSSTANAVWGALENICTTDIDHGGAADAAADTYPHIVQCDNGSEFSAQFQHKVDTHNNANPRNQIKIVHTLSFRPQSNGLVERMNRTILTKLRAIYIRNDSLVWMPYLLDVTKNINAQRNTTTKLTPNELWSPGYHPPPNTVQHPANIDFRKKASDHDTAHDLVTINQARLVARAQKELELNKTAKFNTIFHVGDKVRIRLSSIDNKIRERRKSGIGIKYNVIHWSGAPYTVITVIAGVQPPNLRAVNNANLWNSAHERYVVQNEDGVTVNKEFYGNELVHVPHNALPTRLEIENPFPNPNNPHQTYIQRTAAIQDRIDYLNRITFR